MSKFTSRKFWIAVGAAEALTVALAYLGVEGGADLAGRARQSDWTA